MKKADPILQAHCNKLLVFKDMTENQKKTELVL